MRIWEKATIRKVKLILINISEKIFTPNMVRMEAIIKIQKDRWKDNLLLILNFQIQNIQVKSIHQYIKLLILIEQNKISNISQITKRNILVAFFNIFFPKDPNQKYES